MEQLYTEEEYNKTYDYIKKEYTSQKKQHSDPSATFVGGQPGSGKTMLTKLVLSQVPDSIFIDGDYIRAFHPHLEELENKYGTDYPKATQPFVNRVVEQLIDELSKERYNLIIEGTLRDIHVPEKTAKLLDERGYYMELHVVATSRDVSWKSTIDRGDQMEANGQIPRYVDKAHHDGVVESLPENVRLLSQSDYFENVMIITRDLGILYDQVESPHLDPKNIMELALEGKDVTVYKDIKEEEPKKTVDDLIEEVSEEKAEPEVQRKNIEMNQER